MVHGHEDFSFSAIVKTLAADNIVIDKLRAGEQKPWRHWVKNDADVKPVTSLVCSQKPVKCFARGMRGTVLRFRFQIFNADFVDAHDLTIKLGPEIGMWIREYTLSIPAGYDDWITSGFIGDSWNYDAMYVMLDDPSGELSIRYDLLPGFENSDCYYWDGSNWRMVNYRAYIRPLMDTSCGDLPVSGNINVIEIPSLTSRFEGATVSVPVATMTSLVTIEGSGRLVEGRVRLETTTPPSATVQYEVRFYVDGELTYEGDNRFLTQSITATSGRSAIGEFYQTDTETYLTFRLPLTFGRSIEIRVRQTSGAAVDGRGWLICNQLR